MGSWVDGLGQLSPAWALAVVGLLLVARRVVARERLLGRAAKGAAELIDSAVFALVAVFLVIRPFVVQSFYIPSESMRSTLEVGDRILVNRFAYRIGTPQRGDVAVFTAPPAASPEEKDFIKRVVGLPGDTVAVEPTRALVDGRVVAAFVSEPGRGFVAGPAPAAIEVARRAGLPGLEAGELIARRSDGGELRVRAVRRLALRMEGNELYNDGTLVGTLSGGRDVRVEENLADFGGESATEAAVVLVDGEPEWILARGERLALDPGHLVLNGVPQREPYLRAPPGYAMAPFTVPPGYYWVMGDNRNDSNDSHLWGPVEGARIFGRAEAVFWPLNRLGRLRRQAGEAERTFNARGDGRSSKI